jgi:hypothetical protein
LRGIDPSTTRMYSPAFSRIEVRSAASAALPAAAINVSW